MSWGCWTHDSCLFPPALGGVLEHQLALYRLLEVLVDDALLVAMWFATSLNPHWFHLSHLENSYTGKLFVSIPWENDPGHKTIYWLKCPAIRCYHGRICKLISTPTRPPQTLVINLLLLFLPKIINQFHPFCLRHQAKLFFTLCKLTVRAKQNLSWTASDKW